MLACSSVFLRHGTLSYRPAAAPRAVAIRDTTRTVRSVVVGGGGVEGIM
jgi:hypothetical protein